MRWGRRQTENKPAVAHEEQRLRTDYTRSEREMAVEAVERELHLPMHAHRLHAGQDAVPAESLWPELAAVEEESRPASGWRPWARVLGVSLVIGVSLGGGVVALLRAADGPSEGKVKTFDATLAKAADPSPTPAVNALTGLYIGLQYPGKMGQLERVASTGSDLENYVVASGGSFTEGRVSMSVIVSTATGSGLSENSGYQMRQLKPDQYTLKDVKVGGEPAVIMARYDQQEETLYWRHGKYILCAAISSASADSEAIGQALQMIMTTARWRQ
jgi:hypothetical protein